MVAITPGLVLKAKPRYDRIEVRGLEGPFKILPRV